MKESDEEPGMREDSNKFQQQSDSAPALHLILLPFLPSIKTL